MSGIWGIAAIAAKFGLYLRVPSVAGMVSAALIFGLPVSFALPRAMVTGGASGVSDPVMLGLPA